MQDVQIFRNEVYLQSLGITKGETQRRRWTFYEAVSFQEAIHSAMPLVVPEVSDQGLSSTTP